MGKSMIQMGAVGGPFFRPGPLSSWVLLCLLLLAGPQAAIPGPFVQEVVLDPAACRIGFSLAATLHTVNGTFNLKEGSIRIDPDSGKANGRIVVDVESGRTGERERDRRMHQEILESGRFPEAIFLPDRLIGRLAPTGDSIVAIHGVLRIHGGDHEITVPVKTTIGKGRLSSTARFAVPYVQWGMKDPSTMLLRVEKVVQVQVGLEGVVR